MNINNKEIEVSILCTVYNHEKYLRQCLEGFIAQKTNFKYEVIVHDDCSTDNSKKIIEEYYEKYPDIIVPLYEEENQYSKGKKIMIEIIMPKIRGKYFALCEGDDYWIDENKLQKQHDFMEKNKQYSFCVHNAIVVDTSGKTIGSINPVKIDRDLACEDFIIGGGGFVATNSIFAPTYLTRKIPEFLKKFSLDFFWQIYLSSQGKTYCFSENMSAYRKGVVNSWTSRMNQNKEKYVEHIKKVNNALTEFDDYTEKKYTDVIKNKISINEITCIETQKEYGKLNNKKYKKIIKTFPIKRKTKLWIKIFLQRLYNFRKGKKNEQ